MVIDLCNIQYDGHVLCARIVMMPCFIRMSRMSEFYRDAIPPHLVRRFVFVFKAPTELGTAESRVDSLMFCGSVQA